MVLGNALQVEPMDGRTAVGMRSCAGCASFENGAEMLCGVLKTVVAIKAGQTRHPFPVP